MHVFPTRSIMVQKQYEGNRLLMFVGIVGLILFNYRIVSVFNGGFDSRGYIFLKPQSILYPQLLIPISSPNLHKQPPKLGAQNCSFQQSV